MVNHNEIAAAYSQISARGSHPVGLVVRMYEAILEDFRRALKATGAGDIQGRTASLNHALQIIAELQSVLDHERGGEVSRLLDGFYSVTRSLIVEANIHSTEQHIQRLVDLYMPLRQAWKQVELEASAGKLKTGALADPAINQTASAGGSSTNPPSDTPNTHWDA
jgi:flagellar protein FliS